MHVDENPTQDVDMAAAMKKGLLSEFDKSENCRTSIAFAGTFVFVSPQRRFVDSTAVLFG